MATTWSFLDFTSYGTTSATTVADAYNLSGAPIAATTSVNVAFVLPRLNDPSSLLASDWGTRQSTLAELNANGTLWSTYGASPTDYATVQGYLAANGTLIGDATGSDGYITSAQSRTIWATLTPAQFNTVFGTPLYQTTSTGGMLYWNDGITVPAGVAGLWFDFGPWGGPEPAFSNLAGTQAIVPPDGLFSIGNGLDRASRNFPGDAAGSFYNFPLAGQSVPTATVGLVEALVGTSGTTQPFQQALDAYRAAAGITTPGGYYLVANNGQSDQGDVGERSLDVGMATSINPNGTLGLYVGSGTGGFANSNVFTALQAAFWDSVNQPAVISSSFGMVNQPAPGSPFLYAVQQLYMDAALANVTVVQANNDFGSSWGFANGLANQTITLSSPYVMLVGGTSITTVAAAPHDVTLSSTIWAQAVAGDLATLWLLIQGGLDSLPTSASSPGAGMTTLIETVWNDNALADNLVSPGPLKAAAGDGGVDTTQQTPWYQTAFGLTPTSANPGNATGRGAPDVAANAGGNFLYLTPDGAMDSIGGVLGTSAAAPLWASLIAQIDTVFEDQGLPHLGFMNDLLYTAAAIAPASFNDITFGNNITSLHRGGALQTPDGPNDTVVDITLTGYGYHAGPGYDLTTGLGTPNGMLLARALTAIAHHQVSFGTSPDMLDALGGLGAITGWTSGTEQSVLFQAMSADVAAIDVTTGNTSLGFTSNASGAYAWTNQLAQQSLQAGFDPRLVILFDKQAQGGLAQSSVHAGEAVSVAMNGGATAALQGTLTSAFGFADFFGAAGDVRVARPVAVAETAGGADDQIAIVRVRQNGENSLSLTFYRVDDLNGAIAGLHPGDHGYQEAVLVRAYQTTNGYPSLGGPGYGQFEQSGLLHVNAGDLIAMQLTNNTTGIVYSAFAQANETVAGQPVGHLWNYGVNTWGWEDTYGGGDRDFNDLIVGFDFASSAGSGWLV